MASSGARWAGVGGGGGLLEVMSAVGRFAGQSSQAAVVAIRMPPMAEAERAEMRMAGG